jgi:hypothetical protein
MTIRQLKKEAAALSADKQAELVALLIQIRNQRDPEYKRVIAQRLDDPDPKRWVALEEVKKRLSRN